jgi:formylglycine-generating enzyme required for sulfatase activity
LLPIFTDQGVTDSILGDLSADDLRDLGIDKLGERKRLLAAFLAINAETVASSVASEEDVSETAAAPSLSAATKERPFVNSLGQPFVPIPCFETRFCVWPVRVQDYEVFCTESGAKFPECPFAQDSDHPIVGVSWNEAIEFCIWLTAKERAAGIIDEKTVYRLPTDLEWSAAVGLPHEPEPTPAKRHLKASGYPWGLRLPPPKNAGNYEPRRNDQVGYLELASEIQKWCSDVQMDASDYRKWGVDFFIQQLKVAHKKFQMNWSSECDNFEFTSSVGSFDSNILGIFDLGGNCWEWCMDAWEDNEKFKVLRGSCYASHYLDDGLGIIMQQSGASWGDALDRKCFFEAIANVELYKSSFRYAYPSYLSVFSYLNGELQAHFSQHTKTPLPISGFRTVLHTLP